MNKKVYEYIVFFLILIFGFLGLFYLNKAYGYENPHALQEIDFYTCRLPLHQYDNRIPVENFQEKYKFHKQNGERCLQEAKDMCWWLPNLNFRDKAKYCFTNIAVMGVPGDPRSKIIAAIVTTLVQFGVDCCDEWHAINNKMYWAQYHFEMAEFYEFALNRGH